MALGRQYQESMGILAPRLLKIKPKFKPRELLTCQMPNLSLRQEKFEVWFVYQNRDELIQREGFGTSIGWRLGRRAKHGDMGRICIIFSGFISF